jgi:hypothetical protein
MKPTTAIHSPTPTLFNSLQHRARLLALQQCTQNQSLATPALFETSQQPTTFDQQYHRPRQDQLPCTPPPLFNCSGKPQLLPLSSFLVPEHSLGHKRLRVLGPLAPAASNSTQRDI